jgi:ribosomal protein RSM22 (predicted rRNA methylase)
VEAYLATRMPATYAAAKRALAEIPAAGIETIFDAGAGSGAASLAAHELFPQAALTLFERNGELSTAAREFLPTAAVTSGDLTKTAPFPSHDLVIAAYSLGELGAQALPVAIRLWQAARVAFAVIEPGTTKGFALIRALRDGLIARGAHIAAPCPGPVPCPMAGPDWCHFAARVERSSLHRKLKDGGLGHEDEKFSYVVFSKTPTEPTADRIVRHPRHDPGLIELQLCTPAGLETRRVTKRDRDAFRAARHAEWGDRFA